MCSGLIRKSVQLGRWRLLNPWPQGQSYCGNDGGCQQAWRTRSLSEDSFLETKTAT